jgi:hypothetical protein
LATSASAARSGTTKIRPFCAIDRIGDRAAREIFELAIELEDDRASERGVGRREDRVRVLVVLGLGEEVGRDVRGLRRSIGEDEDLARAGDGVDRDGAVEEPLRAREVRVARPHDLVDAREALGPVRERGDRLRAPGVDHGRDAREVRGGEERVVLGGVAERRREDEVAHAGDRGRDRGHEHARRVTGLASGGVDPDARERPDAEPERPAPVLEAEAAAREHRLALALVERGDARRGALERLSRRSREAAERGRPVELADDEGLRGPPLEALDVAEDRAVALGPDRLEDRPHLGLDLRGVRLAAATEELERLLEGSRAVLEHVQTRGRGSSVAHEDANLAGRPREAKHPRHIGSSRRFSSPVAREVPEMPSPVVTLAPFAGVAADARPASSSTSRGPLWTVIWQMRSRV